MLTFLLFNTGTFYSQSYQFSKYSVDQGLPQQYVYSLNQDDNGFIWIGTGDGLAKFDGIDFTNYTNVDGLAENFVTCSTQDSNGVIWTGHNKGSISKISNGKIESVLSDSLLNSKITSLFIDFEGSLWASSQNGYVIRINPKGKVSKHNLYFDKKTINCISGIIDSRILIATSEGLYAWELDEKGNPIKEEEIKGFANTIVQTLHHSKSINNNFWVGTGESGFYQLDYIGNGKFRSRHFDDNKLLSKASVKYIEEDRYKNLWVSTYQGLFKIVYDKSSDGLSQTVHYNEKNGLSDYINLTLTDSEGNTWIGSYGNGLAMMKDEIFVFYSHVSDEVPNDTRSFYFRDGISWFGLSSGLLKIDPNAEEKWKYYNASNGFKDVAVTSILGKGDELFLSTDGEGLIRFNTKTESFKKEYLVTSYLANKINTSFGKNNSIWLGTEGGLIEKNFLNGNTKFYKTNDGLTHNSIYDILVLKHKIYIGSHSNSLTIIEDGEISHQEISEEDQLMDISAIAIDGNKNIWLATLGNGVFRQENDSFIHISSNEGLKSDYCYSIIADDYGGVWVGHRGALSRISIESNAIDVFSKSNGITDDFNPRATYKDGKGYIWFGTHQRTIKFNPRKFIKNTTPPFVNIKKIWISDEEYNVSDLIELPYKSYKLKIDFIGISFKQPEGVKYQYYLEGYDLNWSESSLSNSITYSRLDDGEYTFKVKACNSDGFCSDETIGFKIVIATPFWKKWWFYLLILIGLTLIIIYIIKKREANQKEIQKKLETELAIRTKEVVKKSAEIEDKNKNITDSINYALKIQQSILPSSELIESLFPESFIFYKPRDIVSGDFYWYEKIDNKFVLACADCTGHGVPGAFMSMISSTLLKEIANQFRITDPAKFLYKLDALLNKTLKKSKEVTIHDGLDLSLCVFDIETNEISFSGAYRPVVVIKKGVLERFKTTSVSIGGDDYMDKEFKTSTIQLEPGDIVYLFTDGYPDQFGGDRGKKLYLKGFESLLESIHHLPMKDQKIKLDEFINTWKRDNKQVDDVLVMGVKILKK